MKVVLMLLLFCLADRTNAGICDQIPGYTLVGPGKCAKIGTVVPSPCDQIPGYAIVTAGRCARPRTVMQMAMGDCPNCGCEDIFGHDYEKGEEFYLEDCKFKCICDGPNTVSCAEFECLDPNKCEQLPEGAWGCKPCKGDCECSGDPHYTTFDGKYFNFMGTCTYTLARASENSTGPWFSVEAKNRKLSPSSGVAYLKKLYVTVENVTVTMLLNKKILVAGRQVALPNSPSPQINVSLAGQYVTLQTTFGLLVRWDGNMYARITVPSSYNDQMRGMCGNFNGKPDDDFAMPNGMLAMGENEFGNSWQTEDDEDDVCKPDPIPYEAECDPTLQAEVEKPENCGKLKDPAGPFGECIKVVDPTRFYQACVYDMCEYDGLQEMLCDQLQAYTDSCLTAGAPLQPWRSQDYCPLSCPPHSSYSLCVSACPDTCVGAGGPAGCQDACVEGCGCDPGFVLSDDKCVAPQDCGCMDSSGEYHPVKGNTLQVSPPFNLPRVQGKVYLSGKFVVLETSFGLRVRFDGKHHADVQLPNSYSGLLCGMAGNFNGKASDDNIKPNGEAAANTNDLGDSWEVPGDPNCHRDCDKSVEEEAKTRCGMITDPNGIFKQCHAKVPPGPYFENCMYGLCATDGQTLALCQALESYADMCAAARVPVAWRKNNTFCPMTCPPGSHYESCAVACPQPSCQNLGGSEGPCLLPCVEGCVCDAPLILLGGVCVPTSACS